MKKIVSLGTIQNVTFAMSGDAKILANYGGRGMFGDTCFGLTVDSSNDAFEFFARLGEEEPELARELAAEASTDSMGMGSVIYFRRYGFSEADAASLQEDDEDGPPWAEED